MAKLGSGPGQCDSKPALLIMTLETEREQLSQGHSVSKSFIGTGVTQHMFWLRRLGKPRGCSTIGLMYRYMQGILEKIRNYNSLGRYQ